MSEDISSIRWAENAETWTRLSRAGYDIYRDVLNTPWFLRFLPDVTGLNGLDIGCGEGTNTRSVARLGARMTECDLVDTFVEYAKSAEAADPLRIDFVQADARKLPFGDEQFDFATSFMCLMDFAHADQAMSEAYRTIKRGGFLQFSILHPCFVTVHSHKTRDPETGRLGRTVYDYFTHSKGSEETWTFSGMPDAVKAQVPKFNVPRYHRPLSDWTSDITAAGFVLEAIQEPRATEQEGQDHPVVADTIDTPLFIHFRCRKPK